MRYQLFTPSALDRVRVCLRIAVLPLLSLLPSATALAQARSAPNYPSLVVHYGDINPSTDEGARELLRRLESSSRWVCGDQGEHVSLVDLAPFYDCYAKTLAQAVSAVGAERLTALYRNKHGRVPTYIATKRAPGEIRTPDPEVAK